MSRKAKQNIWLAVKILIGLVIIMPLAFCVLLSFQSNGELLALPFNLFTKNPTVENYAYAFENYNMLRMFRNTAICLLIVVPVQVIMSATSAFAFAHFDFRFKNVLFAVFMAAMMIPGTSTLVTTLKLVQKMGLLNTYMGICIVSLVNVGGVFMLRQHMMSLPSALWDAAKVDGCNNMKYFFSIVLPLSKSIIIAIVLTSFMGVYNDYFWPSMVTLTESMQTISVGLAAFMGEGELYPGFVYAGTTLCMLVPVLIYIFGIDHIVEGMTAGAVKS